MSTEKRCITSTSVNTNGKTKREVCFVVAELRFRRNNHKMNCSNSTSCPRVAVSPGSSYIHRRLPVGPSRLPPIRVLRQISDPLQPHNSMVVGRIPISLPAVCSFTVSRRSLTRSNLSWVCVNVSSCPRPRKLSEVLADVRDAYAEPSVSPADCVNDARRSVYLRRRHRRRILSNRMRFRGRAPTNLVTSSLSDDCMNRRRPVIGASLGEVSTV